MELWQPLINKGAVYDLGMLETERLVGFSWSGIVYLVYNNSDIPGSCKRDFKDITEQSLVVSIHNRT